MEVPFRTMLQDRQHHLHPGRDDLDVARRPEAALELLVAVDPARGQLSAGARATAVADRGLAGRTVDERCARRAEGEVRPAVPHDAHVPAAARRVEAAAPVVLRAGGRDQVLRAAVQPATPRYAAAAPNLAGRRECAWAQTWARTRRHGRARTTRR